MIASKLLRAKGNSGGRPGCQSPLSCMLACLVLHPLLDLRQITRTLKDYDNPIFSSKHNSAEGQRTGSESQDLLRWRGKRAQHIGSPWSGFGRSVSRCVYVWFSVYTRRFIYPRRVHQPLGCCILTGCWSWGAVARRWASLVTPGGKGGSARLRDWITGCLLVLTSIGGSMSICWRQIADRWWLVRLVLRSWRFGKQIQQSRFGMMNTNHLRPTVGTVGQLVWIGNLDHPRRPYPSRHKLGSPL